MPAATPTASTAATGEVTLRPVESDDAAECARIIFEAFGAIHDHHHEADLGHGRLSVESPVGRALRDRRVGETVAIETPGGERRFRVARLVD